MEIVVLDLMYAYKNALQFHHCLLIQQLNNAKLFVQFSEE